MLPIIFFPLFFISVKSQCFLPVSSNCKACDSTHYFEEFQTKPEIAFATASCKVKGNTASKDYIVSTVACGGGACDGSSTSPFDSVIKGLSQASLEAMKFISSNITIHLTNGDHYLLDSEITTYLPLFRRSVVNLKIIRLLCSFANIANCISDTSKPKIILKTDKLNIYVAKEVHIKEVDITGPDMHLVGVSGVACFTTKATCCDSTANNDSANKCFLKGKSVTVNPVSQKPKGLFILEHVMDFFLPVKPELILENVAISDIYFVSDAMNFFSLISKNHYDTTVRLENVQITNSFMLYGLIMETDIEKDTLHSSLSTSTISNLMGKYNSGSNIKIHLSTISLYNNYLVNPSVANSLLTIVSTNNIIEVTNSTYANISPKIFFVSGVMKTCNFMFNSFDNLTDTFILKATGSNVTFKHNSFNKIVSSSDKLIYTVNSNELNLIDSNITTFTSTDNGFFIDGQNTKLNVVNLQATGLVVNNFIKIMMGQLSVNNSKIDNFFVNMSLFNGIAVNFSLDSSVILNGKIVLFPIFNMNCPLVILNNVTFENHSMLSQGSSIIRDGSYQREELKNLYFKNVSVVFICYPDTIGPVSILDHMKFENVNSPNLIMKRSLSLVINISNVEIYNSTTASYPLLLGGNIYVENFVVKNLKLLKYALFFVSQGMHTIKNVTAENVGNPVETWVLYTALLVEFFGVSSYITDIKYTAGEKIYLHNCIFTTSVPDVLHNNITYLVDNMNMDHRGRVSTISRATKSFMTNFYIKNVRSVLPNPTYRTGIPSLIEMSKTDTGITTGLLSNVTVEGYTTTKCTLFASLSISEITVKDIKIKNVNKTELATFIFVSNQKVIMQNIEFINIESLQSMINFQSSNAEISNMMIRNYSGVKTVFELVSSSMILNNSTAENITVTDSGGILNGDSSSITISNGKFSKVTCKNLGGAIFLWKSSSLNISNSNFEFISSKSGSIVYSFQAVNLEFSSIRVFNSCVSDDGAVLYVKSADTLKSANLTIDKSHSTTQVGVIYITMIAEKTFYFNKTSISNCNASRGSGFFIMGKAHVIINDLAITNNSISTIFAFSRTKIKIHLEVISIYNLLEENSTEVHDIMSFNGIITNITNMAVTSSKPLGSILKFVESEVYIQNATFSGNTNSQSKTFYVISLDNSLFSLNSIASSNPLGSHLDVIDCKNSSLKSSTFKDSDLKFHNPITIKNSEVNISTTSFSNNKGEQSGVIHFTNSKILMQTSKFEENYPYQSDDNKANSIYGTCSAAASLCNVYFKGCNVQSTPGYSIKVTSIPVIEITDSEFFNTKGYAGAAGVMITSSKTVNIKNSKFDKLKTTGLGSAIHLNNFETVPSNVNFDTISITSAEGLAGSGFYVKGSVQFTMLKSTLKENIAKGSISSSVGGAGYIDCDNRYSNCTSLVVNNSFQNNSAQSSVPDLFSATPLNESGNNYTNTSNSLSKISYPLKITYLEGVTTDEEVVKLKGMAYGVTKNTKINVKSGKPFSVAFAVVDLFGERIRFLNDCSGRIIFSDGKEGGSIEKGFSRCQAGIIFFKNVKIFALSNTSRTIALEISFPDLGANENPNLKTDLKLPISLQLDACVKGEVLLPDLYCKKCPPSEYSLINPMTQKGVQTCKLCPDNTICPGGDVLVPFNGYWRASNNTNKIYQCTNRVACINNYNATTKSFNFQCEKEYTGNLCNDCVLGYARIFSGGPCVKCAGNSSIHTKFTMLMIVLTFFILGQVFYYDNLKLDTISTGGVLVKIFVNHFQQLTLVSIIKLGWNVDVGNYFQFTNYLSFLSDDYYSNDCFFSEFDTPLFLFKIVFTNLIPFILTALAAIFLGIYSLVKKFFVPKLWDFEFFTFVKMNFFLTVYLLYPELVSKGFALVNCSGFDETSDAKFLTQSPNVQCWTSIHNSVLYSVGLPSIVIWGFIIPLYFLYILFQNKTLVQKILRKVQTIDDFNRPNRTILSYITKKTERQEKNHIIKLNEDFKKVNETDNSIPQDLGSKKGKKKVNTKQVKIVESDSSPESPTFKGQGENLKKVEIFKFFYSGYRGSYYYWEILIFFKKAIFILLSSLSNEISATVKIVLVLSQFILFFSLTQINYPYATKELNNVELISYHVLFICAILGTLFFTPGIKPFVGIIVALYIAFNTFFFFVWIHVLIMTNIVKILEFKEKFFKILKKINGEKESEDGKSKKESNLGSSKENISKYNEEESKNDEKPQENHNLAKEEDKDKEEIVMKKKETK